MKQDEKGTNHVSFKTRKKNEQLQLLFTKNSIAHPSSGIDESPCWQPFPTKSFMK